jgi:integrase
MADRSLIRISGHDFESAALSLIAAKRSENTRKAYEADLRHWIDFCRRLGSDPISPSLRTATAFRDQLSRGSARRALAAMSGIYRVLLASRVVTSNPFHPSVLEWPAESAVNKTRLVPEHVAEAMIAHADRDAVRPKGIIESDPAFRLRGARDRAILRLLYDTGLRRASIAALKRSDYHDGLLRAVVKGDKEIEVTLPESTIQALDQWLAVAPPSEFMFPGAEPGRALNPLTINKLVGERANAVGAKAIHPHCFRAAFVTACYDAGMPEYEIQASVHHSDPKTTRRYDRGSRGKAVATQLSEFRKGKAKP